jgi:hypothetical protein
MGKRGEGRRTTAQKTTTRHLHKDERERIGRRVVLGGGSSI